MSDFYELFLGSGAANVVLVLVVAGAIWIKQRIKVSKCKSNCYWFDCEAQLDNLKEIHKTINTQRGVLENVLNVLDGASVAPPRTRRASSV